MSYLLSGIAVAIATFIAVIFAYNSRTKRLNEKLARAQQMDAILDQIFGGMGDTVAMAKTDLKKCGETYADDVCKQLVADPTFDIMTVMGVDIDNPAFEQWNNTSLGNCAYVATVSNDARAREFTAKLTRMFLEWYDKSRFSN